MRLNLSLKLAGALLLPALISNAAPPEITTPSELLPRRDLELTITVRAYSTTLPRVALQQYYVNELYKVYDIVDGWYQSKASKYPTEARAVTRLDGARMMDKTLKIQSTGYLIEHGTDESGRYWIVQRKYMPPYEIEDEGIESANRKLLEWSDTSTEEEQ